MSHLPKYMSPKFAQCIAKSIEKLRRSYENLSPSEPFLRLLTWCWLGLRGDGARVTNYTSQTRSTEERADLHVKTAIYPYNLPGNVSCLRRSQECNQFGHILYRS